MNFHCLAFVLRISLVLLPFGAMAPAAELFDETRQTFTLFSFDEVSIPFTQNLRLEMQSPKKHPANPVVKRGEAGSIDSWAVQFYDR